MAKLNASKTCEACMETKLNQISSGRVSFSDHYFKVEYKCLHLICAFALFLQQINKCISTTPKNNKF